MKHNIAVCLVSNRYLDEDYIEEWCEHYYNLGFDFIYILEDLNGMDLKFIDMPYIKDKVDNNKMLIEQIPHRNQWHTYPIFYNKYKTEFNWCGIFDSDEFLILNKHKNIQEFINEPIFKNADVITVNWRNYGDNGKLYKEFGTVKERFTTLSKSKKDIVETKIIIKGNLQLTKFYIGHCCIANNDPYKTVFCNGEHYTKMDPFHKVDYSVAALNHYYTKSTEEFIKRKSIGRLDDPGKSWYNTFKDDFIPAYYNNSERTPEKDKMFEEALNKLKNTIQK